MNTNFQFFVKMEFCTSKSPEVEVDVKRKFIGTRKKFFSILLPPLAGDQDESVLVRQSRKRCVCIHTNWI